MVQEAREVYSSGTSPHPDPQQTPSAEQIALSPALASAQHLSPGAPSAQRHNSPEKALTMVKRPPRPKVDDDARYFTIVHAYPAHPDMELDADIKACAFWLATIVKEPHLLRGIYHKPASPSMVIVGIDKEFTALDTLLGAHRWSEFLYYPKTDIARVTRIYFSFLGTDQDINKEGWKFKAINPLWFDNWKLNNSVIKFPYPKPTYCELPTDVEDPTNKPMCRAHPVEVYPEGRAYKPDPDPAPKPVVGSAEYFQTKSNPQGAWGTGGKKRAPQKPQAARPSWDTPINPRPSARATSRAPDAAWFRAHSSSDAPSESAPSVYAPSDRGQSSDPALGVPPGLKGPAWTAGADGLHEALDNMLMGDDDDGYGSEDGITNAPTTVYADSQAGDWPATEKNEPGVEEEDDGWGGAPILETVREEEPSKYWWQIDCPEHGKKCKPGICTYQARLKAQARRQKEFEERKAERDRLRSKGKNRNRGSHEPSQGSGERWTAPSSRVPSSHGSVSSRASDAGSETSTINGRERSASAASEQWNDTSANESWSPSPDREDEYASGMPANEDDDFEGVASDDGWGNAPMAHSGRGWNGSNTSDWGAYSSASSARGGPVSTALVVQKAPPAKAAPARQQPTIAASPWGAPSRPTGPPPAASTKKSKPSSVVDFDEPYMGDWADDVPPNAPWLEEDEDQGNSAKSSKAGSRASGSGWGNAPANSSWGAANPQSTAPSSGYTAWGSGQQQASQGKNKGFNHGRGGGSSGNNGTSGARGSGRGGRGGTASRGSKGRGAWGK